MIHIFIFIHNLVIIPLCNAYYKIVKKNYYMFENLQLYSADKFYNNKKSNRFDKKINLILLYDSAAEKSMLEIIKSILQNYKFIRIINGSTDMNSSDIYITKYMNLLDTKEIIDLVNCDAVINLSDKFNFNFFYIIKKYNIKSLSIFNEKRNKFRSYIFSKIFSSKILFDTDKEKIKILFDEYFKWKLEP